MFVISNSYITCELDKQVEVIGNPQFDKLYLIQIWLGGKEEKTDLYF